MKYLVMECHPAYAVVLDEEGRFLKVANLNYGPGQTVSSVIELKPSGSIRRFGRWIVAAASLASSLFVLIFGAWQFLLVPYGSVRLQINPDVLISVNRLNYVTGIEGLNQDGMALITDYEYRFKKLENTADELADLAVEMAYLSDDETIWIDVRSSHERWKQETQEQLLLSLNAHLGGKIHIAAGVPEGDEKDETPPQPESAASQDSTALPTSPPPKETAEPETSARFLPEISTPSEDGDRDNDDDEDDDDDEDEDEDGVGNEPEDDDSDSDDDD